MESLGSEVFICQADIANIEDMDATVHNAEERFGHIDGVIHAAGSVAADNFGEIQDLCHAECEKQFSSKIQGLFVLEKILRNRKIDFCLLTSSLSSILGGVGFGAYAAANASMDTFAVKNHISNAGQWISVNWDAWNFAENSSAPSVLRADLRKLAIDDTEGQIAFQQLFSSLVRSAALACRLVTP